MTFTSLFSTVVYTADLNPSEDTSSEMIDYLENYFLINQDILHVGGNLTGDVTGDFQIASKRQFAWLNHQVVKHCSNYLSNFGVNTKLINLYSSKSWPVVCDNNGGGVLKHNHPNSHLSVVFYLQSDENCGGELLVHANTDNPSLTIPMSAFISESNTDLHCYSFEPIVNRIIIFPSRLWHEVAEYTGQTKRYSVTYDILLTAKKINRKDNEMGFIHPSLWVNLYA